MKAIIIGKSGQLANELVAEAPSEFEILSLGRNDVDITSFHELSTIVNEFNPTLIINASAYTAVDKAEAEVDIAYTLNQKAVKVIATIAKKGNIRLLHVSTDFVFDGKSNIAYKTFTETSPIGVYGASKLAGENVIKDIYPENSAIIRTSWVYSSYGSNFVKTMLRLMAEKTELNIVNDQIGCPTYANSLAVFLWKLSVIHSIEKMYHWCDAGVASWYDFAVAIHDIAIDNNLLKDKVIINPIPSSSYPTPAKRPCFSLLDTSLSVSVNKPIHWRKQLQVCLNKIKKDA
jgi:dTDP-4-dehydrorhamnose reductase